MNGNNIDVSQDCYLRRDALRPLSATWQTVISINESTEEIDVVESGLDETAYDSDFIVTATTDYGTVVTQTIHLLQQLDYTTEIVGETC